MSRADIDALLDAALAAHAKSDLGTAEVLCRRVLAADPDDVEALNLLGVIRQDSGRARDSIAPLSRAIEIDPAYPDAVANLARAFRLIGEDGKAVTAARRATELDPVLGEGWRQLGLALMALARHEEALLALREAAARLPDDADIYAAIGLTARALNDPDAAADAWRVVLRQQPERTDAMVNLGWALSVLGQLDEAVALLRRAVERAPDDMIALETLARIHYRRSEGAELVAVCRRFLARHPERADMWALLSNGQIWLGQFDDIEKTRAAVLAAEPENRSFARQISATLPVALAADDIADCRAQLADTNLAAEERITAGLALARALDRAGEYDAAFEAYSATNALLRAADAAANKRFNPADLGRYVDDARVRFTGDTFTAFRSLGCPSELPVFVVGMPRSGTSLVEQIAASHPRVFGAGERKDIVEIVTRLNRDEGFLWPTQWDLGQLREEAETYVAGLRERGGTADRVIDKMPDNIQRLGQIRLLFPNARIVICRRDLRDVCFSCFTTRFGDAMPWANDLALCAERAVVIERLTEHWRRAVPGPLMEIQYEDLVRDLETQSRRLIDFLGLEWDPACLDFHKSERQVLTASAWQVRQPLYDSAIGRWRHYREHLGPMLKILAGAVPDGLADST